MFSICVVNKSCLQIRCMYSEWRNMSYNLLVLLALHSVKWFCRFSKDLHLSKTLSWLLRHGASKEGLELSPEGYIELNKLLQHPKFQGKYLIDDIKRVVAHDAKQRYKLRRNSTSGVLKIKATNGHSIASVTDVGLLPITTPKYDTVVHGTELKCWEYIKHDGLHRMSRNHIHFAKGISKEGSIISGIRAKAEVHIYINLERALADGIKFFESENGVILTRGDEKGFLKPQYFTKVVNAITGMIFSDT